VRVAIGDSIRLFIDVLSDAGTPTGSRPFLIALHGGPGLDHSVLRPGIDVLRSDFQLVLVDQRGHGRSDRDTPARWNLDVWADDVARLCDALDVDTPIVLGVSFGATVALRFATRWPDRPAAVVSVSGSAHRDRPASVRAFERIAGPDVAAVAARHWRAPTADTLVEFRDRCMPYYTTTRTPLATASSIRNQALMLHWLDGEDRTFDLRPQLGQVRCPVLAITGELDPVAPPESAEVIADAVSQGEIAIVAEAGHGVFRDRPSAFREAVVSWVSRNGLEAASEQSALRRDRS
jgi:pimeloyl-ACP methyl ester carboxylesterase